VSSFYHDNVHGEVIPDELWLGGNQLSTLFKWPHANCLFSGL